MSPKLTWLRRQILQAILIAIACKWRRQLHIIRMVSRNGSGGINEILSRMQNQHEGVEDILRIL